MHQVQTRRWSNRLGATMGSFYLITKSFNDEQGIGVLGGLSFDIT